MCIKLVIRKTIFFLFVIFTLFSNVISAQLQYNFERITTDNGLPTNAIKGLQFDEKNRFLWVATESGIVRYNGHGFQSFGDNVSNASLNGRIVFFDKAFNGELFGKLIDGSVFKIKENKALIDFHNSNILGEYEYLDYKYKGRVLNISRPILQIEHSDFVFKKNIYTIIGQNIYQYDKYLEPIQKFSTIVFPFTIKDKLFFLSENGILYSSSIDAKKLKSINNYNIYDKIGVKKRTKFSIFQNHPDENVYLIIEDKLFEIKLERDKITYNLITDKIPTNEFIKYIQIDPITKAIYLGTDNRGLIIARPKYFKRVLPKKNLNGVSASAYAQLLLKKDVVQINTGQLFGENSNLVKPVFEEVSNTATFITKDSIFLMTNYKGIIEYDLRRNKILSVSNEIFVNRNNFIQLNDTIYSFNEAGIAKQVNYGKWVYVLKFTKAPFNFIIFSLKFINNKEILVATTDGLYKYNIISKSFKLYFRDKTKANFRALYELNGYYLLGTYGGGVYMYRNDTIKHLPFDQNKYLSFTHCFIQDDQSRIWASTNKGLFMASSKSLIDFWKKGPGNIKFAYFGKADGIDELEFNGGCSPCAIQLSDKSLSFPGIDGLIQFNPKNISLNFIQPNIFIDKIVVNEKLIEKPLSDTEFPSNTKNIEVHLGISGMLSEENIMLEYKLDSDPWYRTNVKNSILKFGNLSSGSHILSIRLRNTIQDKWLLVDYPFYIKYPWTLNPFMYFVYFLFIIGLVLLYIRFKTIIYQKRQKKLEIEVNNKTESLNKLNDYLLKRNQAKDHVIAIMNHDILTPLKYLHITAKNISESTNQEQIKSSINQIAITSKELEYLTSNMLNWVKFDNIDSLPKKQIFNLAIFVNDLIEFVQPFNQNKNIFLKNEIPQDIIISSWPDSLRVLLYNLLINAIRATSIGGVTIGFIKLNDNFIIFLKDTGIGLNQQHIEYLLKAKQFENNDFHPRSKSGNGVGFQIIRNIIKLMNAEIEIISTLNEGTTINIYMKY
jgi:signal transduction histidine kinase